MKVLVASALTALVLVASGQAGQSFKEDLGIAPETQRLAPACGYTRAQNIARIEWARQIHLDYIALVREGKADPKVAGGVDWHGYWVHVYNRTIALLKQGCH